MPLSSVATALACIFAVALAAVGVRRRWSRLPLPPGPQGYPIIGNALDKAGPFDWRIFPEHRAHWGDITSVTVLGQSIVTLHTYEKAVEVLDKKSLINSSRPILQFLDLGGWRDHVPLLPYGKQLRECRRMISKELNNVKIGEFRPHQEFMLKRLLRTLRTSPEHFYEHIEWFTSSITLKVTYGYDTLDQNDPIVQYITTALAFTNGSTAPGQILEVIPWLRYLPSWFPYTDFKRQASQARTDFANMREEPFKYAEKNIEDSEYADENNFVAKRFKKVNSPEQLAFLKDSAFSFVAAGVETTSSVLQTFIFMMQDHPSIQRLAQQEIDSVVGRTRLPSFNDRVSLPYVNALFKEILRFNVPLPSGLPHKSIADDIQDGYFIPKGTVIIPSIWEMSRDSASYSNAEAFDPSRFLGPNPELDPALYVFGFGRRLCPGILMAEETIYLTISAILATFDILPYEKTQARLELAEGFLNHPLPFKCHIKLRAGVNIDDLTAQT